MENTFLLTIEKGGYNLTEQPELGIVSFNISESELEYILAQIRYNQPFVVALENDIVAFSPSQCVSIKISKGEEKYNEFKD